MENEQVLDRALANLPTYRPFMEETLRIQASNEVGFSSLCLVLFFPNTLKTFTHCTCSSMCLCCSCTEMYLSLHEPRDGLDTGRVR